MKNSILKNTLRIYILWFFFSQNIFCQSTINVIESEQLNQIISKDTVFQKFSGNVIIEYSDLKIICDTILIDEYQNLMRGWGNTHIFNDTLSCKSDSINIKKDQDQIIFYQNTLLKTNNMQIRGDEIKYNYENEDIQYLKGGNVVTNDYEINSRKFMHKLNTTTSQFNENVKLKNDDYYIISENINHSDEKLIFSGKTTIEHINFTINCQNGFLEKSKTLELSNGVIVDFDNQSIKAKKLTRNIKTETNYFKDNVHVTIDENTHIFGQELNQINNISTITDNCYITLLNEQDTTFIEGEIIKIDNDNNLWLDKNITIYGENLQGKCETMDVYSNEKVIEMNTNPVLWFSNIQITGNQISLYTDNNNNLDSIYVPNNPFIISQHDSSKYYNQIKGKILEGTFKKNRIKYAKVYGNGEMNYFKSGNENENTIGLNNVQSGQIELFFEDNNIKEVLCVDEVDSKYVQIDTTKLGEKLDDRFYLNGFKIETQR